MKRGHMTGADFERQALLKAIGSSNLFNTLEVLDRLYLQLQCGVLVAHNQRIWMQLQGRQGPHVIHPLLDAVLESNGLAGTDDEGNHFAGVENSLNSNSQGHLGYLSHVITKEAAVGEDGVVGKCLDASARGQARAGLVEGDVAILTNARQEEVDSSQSLDLGFVVGTMGL